MLHNNSAWTTKMASDLLAGQIWGHLTTGQLGCWTLIIHGFFIFFQPSSTLGLAVGFTPLFCLPIALLGFPVSLVLCRLTASITTVDLSTPTALTHIKYQSTMLTSNFLEKYDIPTSGLANSRKKEYIEMDFLFWASGCVRLSKKRPEAATSGLLSFQEEKEPNPKKKKFT